MDAPLSDFIKQIPAWIILAPVVLGIIYASMMFVIIRRAQARRRKRREAPLAPAALAQSYTNGLPDRPATQPYAIPSRVAQIKGEPLPEPDFDALVPPPMRLGMSSSLSIPQTRSISPVKNQPEIFSGLEVHAMADQNTDPANELAAFGAPANSSAEPSDAVEVMRVLRDLSNGKLIIEIAGRQYRSPAEIPNSELARRFQSVVRELNAMLTPVGPTPLRRPSVEGGEMPNIKLTSQPPASLESPVSLRRTAGLGSAAPPPPEVVSRGIADEIENYLQFKLANTPEFQHRNIHVRPTLEGGVQIQVDNQVYQSMDSVADPEVRAFLMATMREWDARQ